MARRSSSTRTHLRAKCLAALSVLALGATAQKSSAASTSNDGSGPFVEVSAGRAFARFLPLEDADTDAEHFAVSGHQVSLGFGYGYDLGAARLDLGGRFQYLRLSVSGNYSLDYRDDAYRANYDYVAPLLTASIASDWESRVNLAAGLGLGSAMLYSDRKGKPFRGHLLPVYGSFEAGVLFRVAEDLGLRAGISFVPPVDNLYVLTAQLALRAKL